LEPCKYGTGTRPVVVYRQVIGGTVEELMFKTAAAKQAMLRSALLCKSHLGNHLTFFPFFSIWKYNVSYFRDWK